VERDRRRDAELAGWGVKVVRVGEERLLAQPTWVVARIAAALSA
jgi:very-short-patch-repair endonuclease